MVISPSPTATIAIDGRTTPHPAPADHSRPGLAAPEPSTTSGPSGAFARVAGLVAEASSDVTHLDVLPLRRRHQQLERLIGGTVLRRHQDPLRPLDDRPELHRLVQPQAQPMRIPI